MMASLPVSTDLVRLILSLPEEALDCDQVFDLMHKLADVAGHSQEFGPIWGLLAQHFELCPPCGEEYDALLTVVAELDGPMSDGAHAL
jgi:hypothetical protein